MPRFSVVVPAYEIREYLRPCLDSVLGQSFPDLEVVAVDDASTDDSGAILDEYAAHDRRVQVTHLATNVGLGAARNAGIAGAAGDYLIFVDSDDELADGALQAIDDRIAAAGEVDVVLYSFARCYPDGREEPDARSSALLTPDDCAPFALDARPQLIDVFPSAWNKAVRRPFAGAHQLAFAPGYYEDLPWTYPLLVTAQRIVTLDRVCYRYRQRGGTILSSAGRRHLEIIGQFDRVFAYLDAHSELERWRPLLYERMTRHLPTVLEVRERIAPDVRREFFEQASAAFRRHRPAGYTPSGTAGWKVQLFERGDYRLFRAAQLANLAKRRLSR